LPDQPTSWQPLPTGATSPPAPPGAWASPAGAWEAPPVAAPPPPGYYPQGQQQAPGQPYYACAPPYTAPGYSPTSPYYGPIARPSTLTWAARLMGLGAIFAIIALFSGLSALPANGTASAPSYNGGFLLGGLVGTGLWVWMAIANYRGNQWARVTATVFFGLDCLLFLASAGIAASQDVSTFRLVLSAAQWVNGLIIIIFLWNAKTTFYVNNRPR
jgi:hypothetical protein